MTSTGSTITVWFSLLLDKKRKSQTSMEKGDKAGKPHAHLEVIPAPSIWKCLVVMLSHIPKSKGSWEICKDNCALFCKNLLNSIKSLPWQKSKNPTHGFLSVQWSLGSLDVRIRGRHISDPWWWSEQIFIGVLQENLQDLLYVFIPGIDWKTENQIFQMLAWRLFLLQEIGNSFQLFTVRTWTFLR